jgi:hypothetical protein
MIKILATGSNQTTQTGQPFKGPGDPLEAGLSTLRAGRKMSNLLQEQPGFSSLYALSSRVIAFQIVAS